MIFQAQHKADLELLAEKLKESKDEEMKALRSSHDERIKSFEEELRKTQTSLVGREEEVANLKGILSDSKKGLGSASVQISQLEDELAGARKDLRHLKSELGRKETECESLKVIYVPVFTCVDVCACACVSPYNVCTM